MQLDKIQNDGKFFGLFVGPSGSGKKVAAASFPGPILFLDFDGRIRGLMGAPWIDLKGLGEVEYYPPKPKTNEYSFDKVNSKLELLQGQCNIGMCPFKSLYIGSITGAAFGFLQDAKLLTHTPGKGRKLGIINMADPADYGFESNAVKQVLSFLQWLKEHPTGIPNVIVGGHTMPRYGKPGMDDEDLDQKKIDEIKDKYKYDDNILLGERLALTDKLASIVPTPFDHIFKFEKEMVLGKRDEPQHFVTFRSDLARTTFAKLPNGKVNITGKPFYPNMMRMAFPELTTNASEFASTGK